MDNQQFQKLNKEVLLDELDRMYEEWKTNCIIKKRRLGTRNLQSIYRNAFSFFLVGWGIDAKFRNPNLQRFL